MLTKTENLVMRVIYEEAKDKPSLLVEPADLIKMTGSSLTPAALDKVVGDLNMDGYFDLVYSDRHGDRVYCISLTEKGKGYKRNLKVERRNVMFRIWLSVALAFMSFVIGLILKAVF